MDNLYAVWKYDTFPFYICAEVERIDDDGYVKAKGYRGYRFKPVTLLHGKSGERLIQYLRAAKNTKRDLDKGMENALHDRLRTSLTDMGVPCGNVPMPAGFMYPVFGTAFQHGIDKILAGEQPDFAWTPDMDQIKSPKVQDQPNPPPDEPSTPLASERTFTDELVQGMLDVYEFLTGRQQR